MYRIKFKKLLLFYCTGWTIAGLLYTLFRFADRDVSKQFRLEELTMAHMLGVAVVAGLIIGCCYAVLDRQFERPFFRNIPFGKYLLIRGLFETVLLVSAVVMVNLLFGVMDDYVIDGEGSRRQVIVIDDILLVISGFIVSFSLTFIKQVNLKFGPGNLWKMLMGDFHQPKEETRIFMFLDLKSSTTHAENLGHIKFSKLIQDCFRDIAVIAEFQAQIDQYVGDEAVVTWTKEKGLESHNCLRAFFAFQQSIEQRKAHYLHEYGIIPEFKAGAHVGPVTIAEVGVIKREIAYHGDTINTAARIQSKCNDLGENFLISEHLLDLLPANIPYQSKQKGSFELKGKQQDTTLYSINKT